MGIAQFLILMLMFVAATTVGILKYRSARKNKKVAESLTEAFVFTAIVIFLYRLIIWILDKTGLYFD